MKIIYSSQFSRAYRKLSKSVKVIAEKREKIFRKDPFDKRLKTHSLHGRLKGFLSFSIDKNHRIIFEFSKDKKTVYFHTVGDHDIYS